MRLALAEYGARCESPRVFRQRLKGEYCGSGPYLVSGCGRCKGCIAGRVSAWSFRAAVEFQRYPADAVHGFGTLTYAEEPEGGVSREHVSEFVQAMRNYGKRKLGGYRWRWLLAAEYGDRKGRAHYHIVCFGVPSLAVFRQALESCWRRGLVQSELARCVGVVPYVAGYVLKGSERPAGKAAPFFRGSRNPALGGGWADEVARSSGIGRIVELTGDVPHVVRFEGTQVGVPDYVRERMRKALGWEEPRRSRNRAALAFAAQRALVVSWLSRRVDEGVGAGEIEKPPEGLSAASREVWYERQKRKLIGQLMVNRPALDRVGVKRATWMRQAKPAPGELLSLERFRNEGE